MSKDMPGMTVKDIDEKFWRAVSGEKVSVVLVAEANQTKNNHSKDSQCQPQKFN